MYTTEKKQLSAYNFGFISIAVACLFFFNGNINIIDPLPDLIGYLILNFTLTKMALLDEDIAESQKFFRYMIISEIAKIAALLWVMGISRADEKNTGMLLLSFVFAIVDTVILFMAFTKLFSGMTALAFSTPNSYLLAARKPEGRSNTDRIKGFAVFFVIFKAALNVLPEFSNLTTYNGAEGTKVSFLYEFIGLMRGMSIFVTSIVGIVFAVKIFRYFKAVNNDSEFLMSLKERYERDVLPRKGIFVKRSFTMATFFLAFYAILYIDFRVTDFTLLPSELGFFSPDMTNLIPDIISAVFFLVATLILLKHLSVKRTTVVATFLFYFVSSLVAYIFELSFFANYHFGAVYKDEGAYLSYILMTVTAVIAAAAFVCSVLTLGHLLRKTIDTHTGFAYGVDHEKDTLRLAEQHKASYKKLIYLYVGGFFAVGTKLFYSFFAKTFDFAGSLQMVGAFIFLGCLIKVCHDISDEIETKYMLE
ncbi:MAG: hypothetical protein E7641_06190 [Ruminococcaceae bacterium]|nr:hypothetical protein [Oscillospiraceae bacterium]